MNIKHLYTILKTLRVGVFHGLPMADRDRDPLDVFGEWFRVATDSGLYLPEAMTLATSTLGGAPSARMVLLKGYDHQGFTFFTNYSSRKAGELDENPHAALVFHWNVLQRQVRIEGKIEKVEREESASYFETRPRGSRIAAWASRQSTVLAERSALDDAYTTRASQFGEGDIPLPDFWGGYRLSPQSIEFWQGRANRLHDRLKFNRTDSTWASEWLYP